jgi:lipopolysaccharide biosynthesis regulator YciM
MMDLLWVLIPVFPLVWVIGYHQGRKRERSKYKRVSAGLSNQYFRGLNYLLNEESDKAIEAFVKLLEVDSETVETHLALGNLFRRRGEVDRAIRIHQNLIARPSLEPEYRKAALRELGHDYMAAGLLDRAENIFKELLLDPKHKLASLKQLLIIYQQIKDWDKAIRICEHLQNVAASEMRGEIAHFYCEQAEMAYADNQTKTAQGFTKKALSADPSCVRATLILGKIYQRNGRYRQAIKVYRDLLKQDIELFAEALPDIKNCYLQLDDDMGLKKFLTDALDKGAGASVALQLTEQIQRLEGDKKAAEFLANQMQRHPSIKGLMKLIELHIKHASDSAKPSLLMLQRVVSQLLEKKPVYQCRQCGFESKSLFWQCPSCKHWGSVKPIQGIEGE